jgi:hypothetical protein
LHLGTVGRLAALQLFGTQGQVGAEPVEALLPQADSFLVVELGCVLALAGGGQRGKAGGVVMVPGPEVVGRLGISRECVGVLARCGVVQLLRLADLGQPEAFRIVIGPVLTLQEPGQLSLQGGQALGPVNQLVGRVGPTLMAALEGREGLGEPALDTQAETQAGMGQVEVWFQVHGLAVGGDRRPCAEPSLREARDPAHAPHRKPINGRSKNRLTVAREEAPGVAPRPP